MKKLIPLLLLLFTMPVMAKRQFDVELIVFKRDVAEANTNESWPMKVTPISLRKAGELTDSAYRLKKGVSMLSKRNYQLNDVKNAIGQQNGYQVLLHTAWRQGDQNRHFAPIFHFSIGQVLTSSPLIATTATLPSTLLPATLSQLSATPTIASTTIQNSATDVTLNEAPTRASASASSPIRELDGTIQIYVEHYLYANIDLDLTTQEMVPSSLMLPKNANELQQLSTQTITESIPTMTSLSSKSSPSAVTNHNLTDQQQADMNLPVSSPMTQIERSSMTETDPLTAILKPHRMEQIRRMRSSEIHYLDNPYLGVIIQVRKVN